MLGNITSTTHDRLSFTRVSTSGALALLVAVALLMCHGFFGALHLFPTDRGPTSEVAAAQEANLAGARSAHEDPAVPPVGDEYFAVLVVLLLGLFLDPLLLRTGPWSVRGAPRTYFGLRARLWVAYPARGPTGALFQVFRL